MHSWPPTVSEILLKNYLGKRFFKLCSRDCFREMKIRILAAILNFFYADLWLS